MGLRPCAEARVSDLVPAAGASTLDQRLPVGSVLYGRNPLFPTAEPVRTLTAEVVGDGAFPG